MYRNGKRLDDESENFRILLIVTGSVLLIAIITLVVTYLIYNTKVKENTEDVLDSARLASASNNIIAKSTSTEIGKSVNQVKNEMNTAVNSFNILKENNIIDNNIANNTVISSNANIVTKNNTISDSDIVSNNIKTENISVNEIKKEEKKDPSFIKPVEGKIIREFAKDNLVFSNTLDEWIVHLGIDIQADKTTVVKSAADGIVKTIKNDPRYGLTVIVTHENGFETVYSNLLTAEFVTEGEKLKSGQTLGTVGNNATFEIADEPHLHFELIKNGEKIDPKIYIK